MFILKQSDASDYLDMEFEDLAITNILNKYEIKTNNSFLYNLSEDYKALIDYISDLYIEEEPIPEDIIKELKTNLNFKAYLLNNIKDRMQNILMDNSTIVFKEVVTIVNLLSFGKSFHIFESYNFYNFDQLGLLFRDYEEELKELNASNKEDFNLTFGLYVILIELINELCTINSTDVLRKKTINPLINLISETINTVKFSIKLDLNKVNILNNILGKLLFFYSHVPYINSKNKEAQYLIDEFCFNFERIAEGYQLSKNTNFADEQNEKEYYFVFLNSLTTIILTLFYKLELDYQAEDFNNIAKFKNIITLYHDIIKHKNVPVFTKIEDFREELLRNYNYIYFKDLESTDINDIIEDFMNNDNFDSSNMHILHSIILYSSHNSVDNLSRVLDKLVSTSKFNNDYHEFYKLNICDVIINKLTFIDDEIIETSLIDKTIAYIEENKIASHLMSIYSKLYLSLSLYYSTFENSNTINQSSLFYFYYISINGKELLENEYSKINNMILLNHGKFSIEQMNLESIMISESKYIELGQNILDKYFVQQQINLKYNINQNLSNIVTEIFTNEGLNNQLLNKYIESFISRDIFHGLTFVAIEGLCEEDCQLFDLGYERVDIPLLDGYKLKMAYSKVYKHIFENIYEANKQYIKQNIVNLIISYIKSIPVYKDPVTGLFNITKLRTELSQKSQDEEIVLIEIYIEDLMGLNRKYHYKQVNEYFQTYANKINSFIKTFRFYGPKLGILLSKDEDYKAIIKKVKGIKFITKNEEITPSLIISTTWGNPDNILEKSMHSIGLAMDSKNKYNEFK